MHWDEIAGALVVWNIVSFGLQTFPIPENKYFRWFIGVLQFAAANWQKTLEAFKPQPPKVGDGE